MRVPGEGASCLGLGRPGSGALQPPTARPLGGLTGPTTHWLWVRGSAGVGTRHQPHRARSCVLWGRHEGAPGGRLLPGCGASGVGCSPTPNCPTSERAAGAHYPLAVGAGGCGPGDPSPTPQRTLLRDGFARCGGGTRAPGGGASCLGVGRPGSGALAPPTACPLGRLPGPTTHWLRVRGGCGRGDPSPTPQRALLRTGFARCGGGMRVPRDGASCLGVRRPGSGALPPPTARPLGGLPGPTTHWLWLRGGAGVGTRYQPHCRASGVGRSRTPDCLPSRQAAGAHYPLAAGAGGVRAWGPVTNPTARAVACWLCALGGWHEGARGGRLLPRSGASRVGRSPTPNCPTSERADGAHYPLAVGAGVNIRHQPHSARTCVLWGRHEGARGGRVLPGCGASGVGRSPTPDCPPSGWAAGAHYPLAVVAGGCGRGDPLPTPQRALLRAGFARWGGGTRAPGGGASCLGLGRPGSGALPPPTARPLGGLTGPTTHWLWVRAGRSVTDPTARALACCGGGMRVPGGGASCLGVGLPGSGALPPPTAPPPQRAAGADYPLAVGVGGCGRGDLSPTPQRALLRAVGAA